MITGSGRADTDSERKASLLSFPPLFQERDRQTQPSTPFVHSVMPCVGLPLHSSTDVSSVSCGSTMWVTGISTDPEAECASILACVIP